MHDENDPHSQEDLRLSNLCRLPDLSSLRTAAFPGVDSSDLRRRPFS